MFRRKDEDIAQDLLGSTENSGEEATASSEENAMNEYKPATQTTGGAATASAATPSASVPSYTPRTAEPQRPATASAIPATPVYRPANTTESPRGRVPEYRPAGATPGSAPFNNADKASGKSGGRRVLTVGNDILLKGEIATCDRLVIEGAVDATLNEVHTVEIAEGGSFKGSAEIEDAEISGLFEGDLIVRNRLVIYATGKVRGKITYGEIEIERGGEMTGEIKTMEQAMHSKKGIPQQPGKGKTPLEAAAA